MAQERNPGNSDQITRDYLDSLLLELRYIDSGLASTKLELYGETFSTPIMTAALSHMDKHRPNGTEEFAKGAAAAGAVFWTGMGEEAELESIVATGARAVKIIKPHADNAVVLRKIRHAEKCGAFAVGMDIDHSFDGRGRFDNVLGLPMSAKSFDEIKSFVEATKLPFIIKGVLSERDAEKCLRAGVKGILVSHHHGIQSYAVPPLMILPRIMKVVGGSAPVFVDCSISSGVDAFKALALGAAAVGVGRALMPPLMEAGAEGVRLKIEEMTQELAATMARTASPDLRHIDSSVIWRK